MATIPGAKPFQPLDFSQEEKVNEFLLLDKVIVDTVYTCPGCPALNVFGQVMQPRGPEFVQYQSTSLILERINYLVKTSQIISVVIQNRPTSFMETLYFPAECSFQISSLPNLDNGDLTIPHQTLMPAVRDLAEAIACIFRNCSNEARLYIMGKFCHRCGEDAKGHVCSKK